MFSLRQRLCCQSNVDAICHKQPFLLVVVLVPELSNRSRHTLVENIKSRSVEHEVAAMVNTGRQNLWHCDVVQSVTPPAFRPRPWQLSLRQEWGVQIRSLNAICSGSAYKAASLKSTADRPCCSGCTRCGRCSISRHNNNDQFTSLCVWRTSTINWI